jgi:acetolactate synthase I/II/III large subunit
VQDVASRLRELTGLLARDGVRRIFGVPGGGPNLDLVGAASDAGIGFVLMHGETAACLAAAAHGATSGTVGVALVTRGPGLASAVNGLAAATLDGLPLLLLSDAVPAAGTARVAHQRLDQVRLTAAVTRASGVLGADRPAEVLTEALRVAAGPPAGAVHLDVDLGSGRSGLTVAPRPSSAGSTPDQALAAAEGRRRPVVLVGPLAGDADRLRAVLAGRGVPVLTSYQAKGWLPDGDPDHAGLFTNAAVERPLLEQADLVVGVGLDPVEPMPAAWRQPAPVLLVHPCPVDGRYFGEPTVLEVEPGGQAEALAALLAVTAPDWPAGTAAAQRDRALAGLEAPAPGLTPHDLVRAVAAAAPDALVTVDAGAHMLVAMPLWPARRPGDVLISNGLSTMGFALPAAIGAATARPDRPVVCLTGDGGLGMVLAELETVARLGSRLVVVVFNDARLSLIEIKQGPGQGGPEAVGYRPTDFAAVARASGLAGVVAHTADEVTRAVRDPAGPLLVDARVDPSVYPHVIRATRG